MLFTLLLHVALVPRLSLRFIDTLRARLLMILHKISPILITTLQQKSVVDTDTFLQSIIDGNTDLQNQHFVCCCYKCERIKNRPRLYWRCKMGRVVGGGGGDVALTKID